MTDIELIKRVVALMPLGSKDETRWHMCGVAISGSLGKVKIKVTDGHRLVIENYDCEWGSTLGDKTFIFRKEHLPILKMWAKEWGFTDVPFDNPGMIDGCKLRLEIKGFSILLDDVNYPEVERLVPVNMHEVSVGFDAKYLYEMAKALKDNKRHQVKLTFKADKDGKLDPLSPISVSVNNGKAKAVLMPCKV